MEEQIRYIVENYGKSVDCQGWEIKELDEAIQEIMSLIYK